MIIEINGKRYRRLKTIWNDGIGYSTTMDKNGYLTMTPLIQDIDVCDMDKWVMIDGVEYEELEGGGQGCQIQ